MTTIFTSRMASVFIQFQPGREQYYLGECVDLDTIPNPRLGGIDLIQCHDRSGRGYKTLGKKYSPPGTLEITLSELSSNVVSWLEKVKCPFTLYALQRTCGQAGVFRNFNRAAVVGGLEITEDALTSLANHTEDNEAMHEWTLVGLPPRMDAHAVQVARQATVETNPVTGIATPGNTFCDDDCGAFTLPCDILYAGCDSAAGPATANVLASADGGQTWAATTADPFGAGIDIRCIAAFEISAGINRILAVRETVGATPLACAYSDDGGTTWNAVTIGAVNAEQPLHQNALMALDAEHIWLGTDSGNIYFSPDGGESWALQGTSATATAGADVNAVHFVDENYGIAGVDGDLIIRTTDGGTHWVACAGVTGTGNDVISAVCFGPNRFLVGTTLDVLGSLWMTYNAGATWESKLFNGHTTEDATALFFDGEYFGWLLSNTAGPVGSAHRTIDGGHTWIEVDVPANSGFTAGMACGMNEAKFVGLVNGGTGFVGSIG
jgi:photosystem II stability/assembly factor-like uncharacterized protein